ncbi:MAG: DEAD/DEAH box helicase [Pseudomonadota bacterium]
MSDAALIPSHAALRRIALGAQSEQLIDWRLHIRRAMGVVTRPLSAVRAHLRVMSFTRRVQWLRRDYRSLSDAVLSEMLTGLRAKASPKNALSPVSAKVMAVGAELAARTLGVSPTEAQITAAAGILARRIVQMEAGTGKSLAVALAALVSAHSGRPVHVVTLSQSLAERDLEAFASFYRVAGLATGLVGASMSPAQRVKAYTADIVYAAHREIALDYLRSRTDQGADTGPIGLSVAAMTGRIEAKRDLPLRHLRFAIIDEADLVLLDECRSPFAVSEDQEPDLEMLRAAMLLSEDLSEGEHFREAQAGGAIDLTRAGREEVARRGEALGGVWASAMRREAAARLGLAAMHLFARDRNYVVEGGRLTFCDPATGEPATDRNVEDTLRQAIEFKEGLDPSPSRHPLARITFQRIFRRYEALGGVTSTISGAARELDAIYGARTLRVRSSDGKNRKIVWPRICFDPEIQIARVIAEVTRMQERGRPVLIATRTEQMTARIVDELEAAGITASVLEPDPFGLQAEEIALAGRAGRVTVAREMAGHGVDIPLDDAAWAAGGLHVILMERHDSARADRRILHRAGRRREPGSATQILSWEDPLINRYGGWWSRRRLPMVSLFNRAQAKAERLHAQARLDLLRADQRRDERLSFTGSVE